MTATDADTARDVIILRRLDENDSEQLDGTAGTGEMFFSPDGSSIAFFADGKLKRASILGGSVVTIADAPNPRGGVWLPDGTILFSPEYATGLWRVADTGGAPEVELAVDPERDERTFRFPHATPDGEIVLFTVGALDSPNNYNDASIDVYSLETGATPHRDRACQHGPVCEPRSDRLRPLGRSLRRRFRSRSSRRGGRGGAGHRGCRRRPLERRRVFHDRGQRQYRLAGGCGDGGGCAADDRRSTPVRRSVFHSLPAASTNPVFRPTAHGWRSRSVKATPESPATCGYFRWLLRA